MLLVCILQWQYYTISHLIQLTTNAAKMNCNLEVISNGFPVSLSFRIQSTVAGVDFSLIFTLAGAAFHSILHVLFPTLHCCSLPPLIRFFRLTVRTIVKSGFLFRYLV